MSRELGARGEAVAAAYLRRLGYRILERNYRCHWGELDLIAEQDGVLCFVEVKARGSDRFGTPDAAVDARKQARLARVAAQYLQTHYTGAPRACRFDVVSLRSGTEPKLIVDAFRTDGRW